MEAIRIRDAVAARENESDRDDTIFHFPTEIIPNGYDVLILPSKLYPNRSFVLDAEKVCFLGASYAKNLTKWVEKCACVDLQKQFMPVNWINVKHPYSTSKLRDSSDEVGISMVPVPQLAFSYQGRPQYVFSYHPESALNSPEFSRLFFDETFLPYGNRELDFRSPYERLAYDYVRNEVYVYSASTLYKFSPHEFVNSIRSGSQSKVVQQ